MKTGRCMALAPLDGLWLASNTQVNLCGVTKMAMESAHMARGQCTKVSGKETNSMVKAHIYGQTVDHHQVIGFKTKDMVTKYSQMH